MKLTALERRILLLMIEGLKPREIYARLGITSGSYRGARTRILDKHGLTNDTQIGFTAGREGVVPASVANMAADRSAERVDAKRRCGGTSLDEFLAHKGVQ